MKRWAVIFSSNPEPPADVTVVDVRAETELRAIAAARKACAPHHPWTMVSAVPWPRGARAVDDAACRVLAR